jgi:hypothetical protein
MPAGRHAKKQHIGAHVSPKTDRHGHLLHSMDAAFDLNCHRNFVVLLTACKTVQVSETDFIQMCIVQSRASTTWHTQNNSSLDGPLHYGQPC